MSEGFREFGLLQRHEHIAGGQVCLRDSGIIVECLADFFVAGESVDSLMSNYGRSREEIEAALRLVLFARGTNIIEKRAAARVEMVIPLMRGKDRGPRRRHDDEQG